MIEDDVLDLEKQILEEEAVYEKVDYTTLSNSIMDIMLLEQYKYSVNLKQYIRCYTESLNDLRVAMDEVYKGRFLEYAEGKQLDVIGVLLDQPRTVDAGGSGTFGFTGGSSFVKGFGDKDDKNKGGKFDSRNKEGSVTVSLTDSQYRNLLKARAYVMGSKDMNVNSTLKVLDILAGREIKKKIDVVNYKDISVTFDVYDITAEEEIVIAGAKDWFMPMVASVQFAKGVVA